MAEIRCGSVVRSTAGHDLGEIYVVTGSAGGRCLLADGVRRSVESPKSKNPKHLVCIGETSEVLTNETVKSVIRKVRRSLADVES